MTALSDAPTRDPAEPSLRPHGWPSVVLTATIAVAWVGGVAFFLVTRSAMWLDEALTVNIARLPISDLRGALKRDGAPPLYYFLLHLWTGLFGSSNLAARSLSAVFMFGAAGALWFVIRRFLPGRPGAPFVAVALFMSNPYAIRYATEARMYSLVILLVTAGILAVQRALDAPNLGRLAVVAAAVAALIYTQYWSFYLLATAIVLLAWIAWRGSRRTEARRILVAVAVGIAMFVPWLPTFLYQRAHTGTPWGEAILPGIPLGYTFRDFAGAASGTAADRQEGWLLFFLLVPLLLFGVFGRVLDRRRVEIDLEVPRESRAFSFMLGVGLVVALSLNYIAGDAFQSRYSAIVFPFFVCLVARGFTTLRDERIVAVVLAVCVALGFAGGVRNARTQRTQAGEVARALRENAKPGDLVVYCPDQIGPSVHRLAPAGLREVTYPRLESPAFVDWVDYKQRLAAPNANVGAFADQVLALAHGHALWYVSAPGYVTHPGTCERLSDELAKHRSRTQVTLWKETIFEKPALQLFAAPPGG